MQTFDVLVYVFDSCLFHVTFPISLFLFRNESFKRIIYFSYSWYTISMSGCILFVQTCVNCFLFPRYLLMTLFIGTIGDNFFKLAFFPTILLDVSTDIFQLHFRNHKEGWRKQSTSFQTTKILPLQLLKNYFCANVCLINPETI